MASLFTTYFLWFVGGVFGLHHIYLARTNQAILYASTFGCFFVGFIHDFFYIPLYVRQYNCEPIYMSSLRDNMKRRPAWSLSRSIAMYIFGFMLACAAIGPLGPFEPTDTLLNMTPVVDQPLWWLICVEIAASWGITAAISIVGGISAHFTANYSYVYMAVIFGTLCDYVCARYWHSPSVLCLRLLFPIVVYMRVREWVPSSADVIPRNTGRIATMRLRTLFLTVVSTLLVAGLSGAYVYHFITVDVAKLHDGDWLGAAEPPDGWIAYILSDDAPEGDAEGAAPGVKVKYGYAATSYSYTHTPATATAASADDNDEKTSVHASAPASEASADKPKPTGASSDSDAGDADAGDSDAGDADWDYFYSSRSAPLHGRLRLRDVLSNVAASPWWADFKEALRVFWGRFRANGEVDWSWFSFDDIDWNGLQRAYEILEIDANTVNHRILAHKRRELAKRWHPDRHAGPGKAAAEARFTEVQRAYEAVAGHLRAEARAEAARVRAKDEL